MNRFTSAIVHAALWLMAKRANRVVLTLDHLDGENIPLVRA